MSLLDALAGVTATAFSNIFRPATVTKTTATSADGRGGATAAASNASACRAIVEDYADARRAAAAIPVADRRITVLAATLTAVPIVGDAIAVEGRSWTIVGVDRDPAGATWELQGR